MREKIKEIYKVNVIMSVINSSSPVWPQKKSQTIT